LAYDMSRTTSIGFLHSVSHYLWCKTKEHSIKTVGSDDMNCFSFHYSIFMVGLGRNYSVIHEREITFFVFDLPNPTFWKPICVKCFIINLLLNCSIKIFLRTNWPSTNYHNWLIDARLQTYKYKVLLLIWLLLFAFYFPPASFDTNCLVFCKKMIWNSWCSFSKIEFWLDWNFLMQK
jgi:hypothetical protein